MKSTDVLTHVLSSPAKRAILPDSLEWWHTYRSIRQAWPKPITASIAGGFASDRIAWAFSTAYQSALRTLRPQLPDDAPAAFCVSESGGEPGTYQTLVRTSHDGVVLQGAKSWIASGPQRTVMLVLARLDSESDTSDGKRTTGEPPRLRIVQIDSGTPGVTLTPLVNPRRLPELPQSSARFDAVVLPADALLAGDGQKSFVLPFRSLEAVQVNAAVTAMLLREGRARGWDHRTLERFVLVLAAFVAIAELDPLAAGGEIALAGALEAANLLHADADRLLEPDSDEFANHWRRDRQLLAGMGASRTQRAEKAWQRLASREPG